MEDSACVLELSGELDVATTPSIGPALAAILDQGISNVVVDLTGCDFVDSSGLHELVRLSRRCESAGGGAILVAPQPWLVRTIKIAALDDVLDTAPSVDEARAGFDG